MTALAFEIGLLRDFFLLRVSSCDFSFFRGFYLSRSFSFKRSFGWDETDGGGEFHKHLVSGEVHKHLVSFVSVISSLRCLSCGLPVGSFCLEQPVSPSVIADCDVCSGKAFAQCGLQGGVRRTSLCTLRSLKKGKWYPCPDGSWYHCPCGSR